MFRVRQNKITVVAISLSVLFVFISQAKVNGEWTQGNFEVYIFKVGQGDSQLIVSPSGITLLIDSPEISCNSSSVAPVVADTGKRVNELFLEDDERVKLLIER